MTHVTKSTQRRRQMKIIRILGTNLALGFALATGQAGAESITINNADFDTPPLALGTQTDSSSASFFSVYKWNGTPAAGNIGIYNPTPGAWQPGVAPSNNVAYICCAPFSGTLWQKTGAVLENGTYTLGVDVAYPKAANIWPTDVRIRLYAGNDPTTGVLLKEASQGIPALPGVFERRTLTFGPADPTFAALFAANQLQ